MTARSVLTSLAAFVVIASAGDASAAKDGESTVRLPYAVAASGSVTPRSLRVGDLATLEITIHTPAAHVVAPFAPPTAHDDFEVESVSEIEVEKTSDHWTHRIGVTFRPRRTGELAWPTTEFAIARADGMEVLATMVPVRFEVVSVLREFAGRIEPFGPRAAPPRAVGAQAALRTFAGALAMLAAVGLAAWAARAAWRRRDRRRHEPADTSWERALRELDRAASQTDVAARADAAATALRRYVERRFNAPTRARTAEELADERPPFGATSRWPTFTALLLELDALRFSRRHRAAASDARPAELLDRVRDFVEASIPPEALQ